MIFYVALAQHLGCAEQAAAVKMLLGLEILESILRAAIFTFQLCYCRHNPEFLLFIILTRIVLINYLLFSFCLRNAHKTMLKIKI